MLPLKSVDTRPDLGLLSRAANGIRFEDLALNFSSRARDNCWLTHPNRMNEPSSSILVVLLRPNVILPVAKLEHPQTTHQHPRKIAFQDIAPLAQEFIYQKCSAQRKSSSVVQFVRRPAAGRRQLHMPIQRRFDAFRWH